MSGSPLRVRGLGRVAYRDAEVLQRALHARDDDYLLLLEHPHVYTLGSRANTEHVLTDPAAVGAELVRADRGGDVTYHGPGQLVGYPIVSLREWRAGERDVVAYVRSLERVLVGALADLGVVAGVDPGYTGVWVGEEKIAAIGVRVARGRTRHGFALNVDPDLSMFSHIVPCGIPDRGVTSIARVLGRPVAMDEVIERVVAHMTAEFDMVVADRADVGAARLADVMSEQPVSPPRPTWMRVKANMGPGFTELKRLVRGLELTTVCEEAGCPNIYECWSDRTATFMINGDRCTRACSFCLVDTRKPLALDPDEPRRVAEAIETMGLAHAVITCVARDDLPDGGAGGFAATVAAVRERTPGTQVELLISDCKGDPEALATIFAARPDIVNHNLETVLRLQRLARPSAGYARSLAVLAAAKDAGLVTKSGLIAGMGESYDEMLVAIADLRAVGVDILTVGQYLQPSPEHLPVARWWTPEEFERLRDDALALGFAHVECGPLVRSSYHARAGAEAAAPTLSPRG